MHEQKSACDINNNVIWFLKVDFALQFQLSAFDLPYLYSVSWFSFVVSALRYNHWKLKMDWPHGTLTSLFSYNIPFRVCVALEVIHVTSRTAWQVIAQRREWHFRVRLYSMGKSCCAVGCTNQFSLTLVKRSDLFPLLNRGWKVYISQFGKRNGTKRRWKPWARKRFTRKPLLRLGISFNSE